MHIFRKTLLPGFLASIIWLFAPATSQAEAAAGETGAKIDALFAELAEPGRGDWKKTESEISRLWSCSGSDSMDLLLQRGRDAMASGDLEVAVEHFSALTDHAPEFAEGWNARATAYFFMNEYALSIADVEQVLALNPRHFGAFSGLATMFEAMGENRLAIKALEHVRTLSPNRPGIDEAINRLQSKTGAADL